MNVLYRDGYHAAVKLIEEKSRTTKSRKSLILWEDDFTSENEWKLPCAAPDVPEDIVMLELKCDVVAVPPYRK